MIENKKRVTNSVLNLIYKRIIKIIKGEHYKEKNLYSIFYEVINNIIIYLTSFFAAILFDRVILVILYKICLKILNPNAVILRYLSNITNFSIPRIYFFSIFIFIIFLLLYWKKEIVYKFRYLFAFIVLVLFVIGKFSGSSLGFYDGMLVDNTEDYIESTLLGTPQGIRGDEWATEKPYYFAQESVNYSYYNENLMIDGCDMVVSAFAPVKNILIIARPDLWGFLFLPRDYAFSFYWNLRIILLFMASFEFAYMLTKKKKYGVIWGLFICFAPPIQWWLSQVLMIIVWSGEYFIVIFNQILEKKRLYKKILFSFLAAWFAVIYILTMYPAVQVPMGYIFACLLFYILAKRWKDKPFHIKNISCYIGIIVIIIIFSLYYYDMSKDGLATILNTTYPGKTRSWFPLEWDYELLQFINPLTWGKYLTSTNNCEASQYYSFLPFIIIASLLEIKNIKKKKHENLWLIAGLISVSSFLWGIAHLPKIDMINKITLLSFSYPVRILFASGFGYMLTILMMLSYNEEKIIKEERKNKKRIVCAILFIIIAVFAVKSELLNEYFEFKIMGKVILLTLVALFSYMGYFLLLGGKKATDKFVILFLGISVFSTIFINPITYGTDSMFEKVTMKKIREINQENPGRWMVSGNTTISNLVTAQGVARTTGTYYYPDKKMMEIIDPLDEYKDVWNQYAHIDMRLTYGENLISQYDYEQNIELSGVNKVIYINIETARELQIKYIFTKYDISSEYIKSNQIKEVYTNALDGWTIYAIQ